MLPDSLCSSCDNGYTSLDLHSSTQLCIGLLHYRKSYDFTLCPRRNTEHRTTNTEHRTPNVCDIDREKLRTMSSQSQESQVGGTGNAISNPLCILTSLWKERTITINSFCCRCCCFIFGKNSAPMYMYESRPKREVIHFSFLFLHRRWTVENVLGERYNFLKYNANIVVGKTSKEAFIL